MLACGGEAVPDLVLSGLVSGSACILGGDDGSGGEVGVGGILSPPLMLEFVEDGGSV